MKNYRKLKEKNIFHIPFLVMFKGYNLLTIFFISWYTCIYQILKHSIMHFKTEIEGHSERSDHQKGISGLRSVMKHGSHSEDPWIEPRKQQI